MLAFLIVFDTKYKPYGLADYEVRLVGGRGNAGGEQQTYFNLELEKDLAGRNLKEKEFTFKLVDVTDSANPVELGETTNDAKGKIVFSDLSLSKPGIYQSHQPI